LFDGLGQEARSGSLSTRPGPSDIGFGFGTAWVLISYAGNPLARTQFEAAGIRFGSIIRVDGIEQWAHVLDVSDHEITNPDGDVLDTNPFGMSVLSNRIVVADAGANALLHIGLFGQISTLAVFPSRMVGPATIQSVPTTVIEAPDGDLYVGELTVHRFRSAPLGSTAFLVAAARPWSWQPASPTSSISPSTPPAASAMSSNTMRMASFRP
jgi:hypothetical protein